MKPRTMAGLRIRCDGDGNPLVAAQRINTEMQISCPENVALSAPIRKATLICPSKIGVGVGNSTTHDVAPLASCGEAYFLRGWRGVIRCWPRSKRPVGTAWRPPYDLAELRDWAEAMPRANIGLAAGYGFGWIDFDFDDAEIMAAVRSVVPASPIARRGMTGQAEPFQAPGGLSSFKIMRRDRPAKPLIEVMASSGFVLVPASIHPDGPRYEWLTPDNPLTLPPSALPMLPSTIEADLRRALAPWAKVDVEVIKPVYRPAGRSLSDRERDRYGLVARAALESYQGQISNKGKGGRSNLIFAMAWALSPYVRERILTKEAVLAAAIQGAEACGFVSDEGERQVQRDVARGLKRGANDRLRDLDNDPHWARR